MVPEPAKGENDALPESSPENATPDEEGNTLEIKLNKNTLKKSGLIGAVVLVAILAAVVLLRSMPDTTFADAADQCFASNSQGLTIDSDGRSMYLDGEGKESSGMNYFFQFCILQELNVPDSVVSRINNTNSTMGVQQAEWDRYKMSWTYHPNAGLNVSIDLK